MEFNSNDLVLLSTVNLRIKGKPTKLKRRFSGPFKVLERISRQAYRLALPTHWKIHDVFHVSLLKQWRTSSFVQVPESEMPALEESEDEPRYEVEWILRWRKKRVRGKPTREYYVLWKDYPLEEASWIPANNFDDQEMLQQNLLEDNSTEEK